jgi:glycosyltransferase involved in cell wall biosynthesis
LAEKPTISACLAVYNGGDYLARAIGSMVDQTRKPDEILVVDDGSTDNSVDIARRFAGVRVIEQKNAGIGAARARLVEEAAGDWIAFNDHDDWWAPEKLEVLEPYTADPAVTLIYSSAYLVDENDIITEANLSASPDSPPLRHLLPNHNNILVPATLLKRTALLEAGNYRPEMKSGEDTLSFFMLIARGKVVQVPERLATIFKREGSTSAPGLRSYQFERAIYTDHLLPRWNELFGAFPRAEQEEAKQIIKRKVAHLDSIIGCWQDWEGDHLAALRSYKRSFASNPIAKGNLYRMARSIVGLRTPPPGHSS